MQFIALAEMFIGLLKFGAAILEGVAMALSHVVTKGAALAVIV